MGKKWDSKTCTFELERGALTKEVDNDDETAVEEQLIGGDGGEHPVDVRPVGGPFAKRPIEAMLTVAPKAVTGLRDDALAAILA